MAIYKSSHPYRLIIFGLASLVLLTALLLPAYTHWVDTVGVSPDAQMYEVSGSRSVGQTFVCHHAGLDGISVLLQAQPGAGDVTLHLRESPDSESDIATATIAPVPGSGPVFYHFPLPVQDDVNGRAFFLLIESPGSTVDGALLVPYDAQEHPDYVLYADSGSFPGHLSFQLHYSNLYIVKDLGGRAIAYGVKTLWLLFLSALLLLLPGGALVVWLLREGDWVERVIVAAGLGVAVNALLVYATLAGLRLNKAVVASFLVLCAAVIGVRIWISWRSRVREQDALYARLRQSMAVVGHDPVWLVGGLVALLVCGVRIWVIRDMVAPRWGDSYQHAVIAQLLVDRSGIFESWEPYALYTGLTMHFGFHANVALFDRLSSGDILFSVIWVGQLFNILAILVLYPLGKRIGGCWAGVLAVLVGGLLSTTPMMYVNWGRYPQLTGQVLLPVAAWLLWKALERPKFELGLISLAALGVASQFLSYYRMPYYFSALAGAVILCGFLPKIKLRWRQWMALALRLVGVAALAAIVLIPWAFHISQSHLTSAVIESATRAPNIGRLRVEYAQWLTICQYVPSWLLLGAGIALLWALCRRAFMVISVGLWGIGLFGLTALQLIGFPGSMHLTAFASMIFVYAPVSLLVGWLGADIVSFVAKRKPRIGLYILAGLAALASLAGAYRMLAVSDPGYDLVKPADMDAMAWIRANTPPNARFLVNGFLIYNGNSIVGSDAGWWIPFLALRANTVPPQYPLLNEQEVETGYNQRLVDLVTDLRESPISTQEGLQSVCANEITHVYIGKVDGRVGVPPPEPLFTAEQMSNNPAFQEVYNREGVRIFELTGAGCQP